MQAARIDPGGLHIMRHNGRYVVANINPCGLNFPELVALDRFTFRGCVGRHKVPSRGMLRFSEGKGRLRILPSVSNKKELNVATAQGSRSLIPHSLLRGGLNKPPFTKVHGFRQRNKFLIPSRKTTRIAALKWRRAAMKNGRIARKKQKFIETKVAAIKLQGFNH